LSNRTKMSCRVTFASSLCSSTGYADSSIFSHVTQHRVNLVDSNRAILEPSFRWFAWNQEQGAVVMTHVGRASVSVETVQVDGISVWGVWLGVSTREFFPGKHSSLPYNTPRRLHYKMIITLHVYFFILHMWENNYRGTSQSLD